MVLLENAEMLWQERLGASSLNKGELLTSSVIRVRGELDLVLERFPNLSSEEIDDQLQQIERTLKHIRKLAR